MKRTRTIILFLMLLLPVSAAGQDQDAARARVVDKMVATVNGQLVTYSDVLWQLALQPDTPIGNPRSEDLRNALDVIIQQRLIVAEAEKLPTIIPTDKEVDAALTELINRFPSRNEFEQRARRVNLGIPERDCKPPRQDRKVSGFSIPLLHGSDAE